MGVTKLFLAPRLQITSAPTPAPHGRPSAIRGARVEFAARRAYSHSVTVLFRRACHRTRGLALYVCLVSVLFVNVATAAPSAEAGTSLTIVNKPSGQTMIKLSSSLLHAATRHLQDNPVESRMMAEALELAATRLRNDGQLYPFALGVDIKGKDLWFQLGRLKETLTDIEAYGIAKAGLSNPALALTACVVAIDTFLTQDGQRRSALRLDIESIEGTALTLLFPYVRGSSNLRIDKPIAKKFKPHLLVSKAVMAAVKRNLELSVAYVNAQQAKNDAEVARIAEALHDLKQSLSAVEQKVFSRQLKTAAQRMRKRTRSKLMVLQISRTGTLLYRRRVIAANALEPLLLEQRKARGEIDLAVVVQKNATEAAAQRVEQVKALIAKLGFELPTVVEQK